MIDRRAWSIFVFAVVLFAGCATTKGKSGDDVTASSSNTQGEQDRDRTDSTEASGEGDEEGAESKPAYDAGLSNYDYPYEVQTREFEAQGATREMAYMDVEPQHPNGRTVVLLHGKNFSGAYWERTIAHLVERGYRVVAPDQIGFGKSSKPTDFQYTFQALATHTRELLEALGVEGATIVGHSMGGMLATRFALMFPGFTESLTLVNPIGLEDWKRKVPYQTVDQWYDRELDKTPAGIRDYMRQSYFDGEWEAAYDPLVEIQAGWTRGPDYERIARVSALTYDMIFTQPVLYEFGDLNVETLLIIGQRDRTALGTNLVSPDVAKTMGRYNRLDERVASEIPNSRLVELEGIGHIPQYEAFDRYIEVLTGFLGG
jgi:pimeloyl-ACP methyl ester carboxylesterase